MSFTSSKLAVAVPSRSAALVEPRICSFQENSQCCARALRRRRDSLAKFASLAEPGLFLSASSLCQSTCLLRMGRAQSLLRGEERRQRRDFSARRGDLSEVWDSAVLNEESSSAHEVSSAQRSAPQQASSFLREEPLWQFESKPGGRLHLKALQRLHALAAAPWQFASEATSRDVAAPTALPSASRQSNSEEKGADCCCAGFERVSLSERSSAGAESGPPEEPAFVSPASRIPLFEHRPRPAQKRRVSSALVGDILERKCRQARLLFETPSEAAAPARLLRLAEERDVQVRAFVRLLANHLPSLETRSILKAFCGSSRLDALSSSELLQLLSLMQLGERGEEEKSSGLENSGLAGEALSAAAPDGEGSSSLGGCGCGCGCCWFQLPVAAPTRVDARLPKGPCFFCEEKNAAAPGCAARRHGSDGCSRLKASALLRILRGEARCVPPCLRRNQALKHLLSFVHSRHPLLASMQSARTPQKNPLIQRHSLQPAPVAAPGRGSLSLSACKTSRS